MSEKIYINNGFLRFDNVAIKIDLIVSVSVEGKTDIVVRYLPESGYLARTAIRFTSSAEAEAIFDSLFPAPLVEGGEVK